MRAVVQTAYGEPSEVLTVREVDAPAPGPGEVLVRVRAASVHPDVWHVVTGLPRVLRLMGSGLRRPTDVVPGTDMSGIVEEVGPGVDGFAPGHAVYGETTRRMEWRNGGAYAEFVTVPHELLAPKPAHLTFEQAACVPTAGMIAIQNLPRPEHRLSGGRVLVNGAGGGVGGMAVQLARAAGAHVTAVDHTAKLELLRILGADEVIDYTVEDATTAGGPYDLVFDVVGNHAFPAYRQVLSGDGIYVLIGHDQFGAMGRRWLGSIPKMLALVARSRVDPNLPKLSLSGPDRGELARRLRAHVEAGAVVPVVAASFPLERVVESMELLASGDAVGRIVVVAGDR